MIELTKKEQETLLLIYKDCTQLHSATSLGKALGITQVGAMKLLKRFEKNGLVTNKSIGKTIVYKLNIEEELAKKLIGFALVNEARKHERWKEEFKYLYKKGRIMLFYGSASRNYAQAHDIDIMVIGDEKEWSEINQAVQQIQASLPKKIHTIKATKNDLRTNIKKHNDAMIEIIKTAVVLYGYDEYMEVLNEFASF